MSDKAIAYSAIEDASVFKRSRAFNAILYGGLTVGVLDGLYAVIATGLRGGNPIRMFQGIASGLLGRDSFSGGLKTALLGLLLHFLIATIVTTIYYGASLRLNTLVRRAVIWGMIYGVAVYFVMGQVVVPLSAIQRALPFSFSGLMAHIFLVGLPIALVTRRFAKANRDAEANHTGSTQED